MKSRTKPDSTGHLRDAGEAAQHGPDIEQLMHEYDGAHADAQRAGLPVQWRDTEGNALRGRNAQIVAPSADDIQNYATIPRQMCGFCRYFRLEEARKAIVEQRFAEKLERDYGWSLHHLGVPLDAVGLCGAHDGSLATTAVSKADDCDQFRPSSLVQLRKR